MLVRDEPVHPEKGSRLLLEARVEFADFHRRMNHLRVASVERADPVADGCRVGRVRVGATRSGEVEPPEWTPKNSQAERADEAGGPCVRLREPGIAHRRVAV